MDVVGTLEDIVASPLTLAIGGAIGFIVGLVVRPFIEAQSSLYKETVSSRRVLQRDTLVELQTTLAILDPRPRPSDLKPDERRNQAERRVEVLLHQVNDSEVRFTVQEYLYELKDHYQKTSPGARPLEITPLKSSARRSRSGRAARWPGLPSVNEALGRGLSWYYDEAQRAIGVALNQL